MCPVSSQMGTTGLEMDQVGVAALEFQFQHDFFEPFTNKLNFSLETFQRWSKHCSPKPFLLKQYFLIRTENLDGFFSSLPSFWTIFVSPPLNEAKPKHSGAYKIITSCERCRSVWGNHFPREAERRKVAVYSFVI